MTARFCKILMCLALGAFAGLVAYDNVIDYATNYAFVQHVLSMDTTPVDPAERGRAITSPLAWRAAYALIIAWEAGVGALFLVAAGALGRALRAPAAAFAAAKRWAHAAGTMAFLLWFFGFEVVGGEWFAMWRSAQWNGQEAAFRFVLVMLAALIYIAQPDGDEAAAAGRD